MVLSAVKNMSKTMPYFIAVSAMAVCMSSVQAQDVLPVPTEEITVTAARIEEPLADVPQSVEIVSSEEIARHQPRTVGDAMRYELGIWTPKLTHAASSLIVRGLVGTQILPMIDGVRLNNSQLKGGLTQIFNLMDINDIERIEILKGPGAVQYGSDAIGGVVNIITKSSNLFPERSLYGLALRGRYGSVDGERRESMDLMYAAKSFNVDIGGTLADIGDMKGGGDLGTLSPSSWNEEHFYAKTNIRFSENKKLRFSYLNTFREDINRYSQSKTNPSGIPRTFRPEEGHTLFSASYEAGKIAGWLDSLKVSVSNQTFDNVVENNREGSTKITQIIRDRDENMLGFGVQMTSPIAEKMRIIYGTEYRFDNIKETKLQYVTTKSSGAVKLVPSTDGQTPDGTYDVINAFSMFEWNISERMKLFAGLRFERAHLDSNPSPEDLSAGFTLDDIDIDKQWGAFTESLGALFPVGANVDVTANIATGFRSPNFTDALKFGVVSTDNIYLPNPGLNPEHSISYELGARAYYEKWSGNVSVFYTDLKDVIKGKATGGYLDIDGDGQNDSFEATYTNRNIGSAYVYGAEAKYDVKLNSRLSLFGNIAWTLGKDTESEIPLGFIPPLNGLLGLRWQKEHENSLWMELSARAAAAQTRVTPEDRISPGRAVDPSLKYPDASNPPLRSDYSMPGYTVLDLRLGKAVSENINLTAGIENILDRKYRDAFSDIDAPGRNIVLGVEIKF